MGDVSECVAARAGRDSAVRLEPFPGVMGTALDEPGGDSTMPPRKNGGNMDVKQLVKGTTLYLPVWVDGALFSVGDGHGAQGDGEVCVTAVEMMARVTLRFGVERGRRLAEPQFRTAGPLAPRADRGPWFATTANGPDLFAAAQQAVRYMIEHLVRERGVSREEAYILASVAVLRGPVARTGAPGPIESIYLRDPDGNLLEIARQVATSEDPLAPIRTWLSRWEACVRAADFEGGRRLCAPDLVAFGTVAYFVEGIERVMEQQWRHVWPRIRDFTIRVDEARGAVVGGAAWVAAPWDSTGVRGDGSTFARPGRLTIAFARRDGRWLATHTHFSLSPER